jgi:hypothetical protein
VVQGGVISEDLVGLKMIVSRVFEELRRSITFLTTGRTHGFALSSLYAPIPRSTFLSKVSAL